MVMSPVGSRAESTVDVLGEAVLPPCVSLNHSIALPRMTFVLPSYEVVYVVPPPSV